MAKKRRAAPSKAAKKPAKKIARPNRAPRILVVEARFYNHVADALLQGATEALQAAAAEFDVITVPGALEIPAAIAIANENGRYDGVVALGCVIQGETFHFDIVAMQSARALIDLSVALRLPAGNGILTVDNEAQALTRANPAEGNKGGEAVKAALALARLKRDMDGR